MALSNDARLFFVIFFMAFIFYGVYFMAFLILNFCFFCGVYFFFCGVYFLHGVYIWILLMAFTCFMAFGNDARLFAV